MQKVHTNIVKKGLCLEKQISNLDSKSYYYTFSKTLDEYDF
jgi:hypothetical protein